MATAVVAAWLGRVLAGDWKHWGVAASPLWDANAHERGRVSRGELATSAEAARLEGALAALPTSEAQDGELLRGGVLEQRAAMFVEFRMLRKRALRQAAARIRAALASAETGAEL